MSRIYSIQQEIFQALFQEGALSGTLLKESAGRSVLESLAIYRNSSKAALLNTLRETYEVCVKIVGIDFFNAMASLYIDQAPSRSPNINQYGETFSDFIAAFPHAQSLPYLSDIARLEWVWAKALHSENSFVFNFNALMGLSIEDQANIKFKLPVSASLIASVYPIHHIWALNHDEGEGIVDLDKGGVRLLVWRKDMQMQMEVLTEKEWVLLAAIQSQAPLSKLSEMFSDEERKELPQTLSTYVARGWITG